MRISLSVLNISLWEHTNVKITPCFLNTKMLMFAKVSLASLVYDIIDVFSFPLGFTKDIFLQKNNIIKFFVYLILTYTDNAPLFFVFICKWE